MSATKLIIMFNLQLIVIVCRHGYTDVKQQGWVAGTRRRLGLDVDSTHRLGSLDTNERNYRVARPSHNKAGHPI